MTTTDTGRTTNRDELLIAIDGYVSDLWRTRETLNGQAGVVRAFMEALGAPEATVEAVLGGDRAVFFAWHTAQMKATD